MCVINPSKQFNCRSRHGLKALIVRSVAYNLKLKSKLIARINCNINSLVFLKTRYNKEIIPIIFRYLKKPAAHRRRYHYSLTSIVLSDTLGNIFGIGNKIVNSGCTCIIPHTNPCEEIIQQLSHKLSFAGHLPGILIRELPCISHRRMAIADMDGIRMRDNSFCHT